MVALPRRRPTRKRVSSSSATFASTLTHIVYTEEQAAQGKRPRKQVAESSEDEQPASKKGRGTGGSKINPKKPASTAKDNGGNGKAKGAAGKPVKSIKPSTEKARNVAEDEEMEDVEGDDEKKDDDEDNEPLTELEEDFADLGNVKLQERVNDAVSYAFIVVFSDTYRASRSLSPSVTRRSSIPPSRPRRVLAASRTPSGPIPTMARTQTPARSATMNLKRRQPRRSR